MKHLTWKIDKTIPTECPDYVIDKYTGEYPTYHCFVYHCKTITEDRTAEFETEKEAEEFVSKAPLSCYDFTLDGKLLKDDRKRPETITIGYTSLTGGIGTITITPPQ